MSVKNSIRALEHQLEEIRTYYRGKNPSADVLLRIGVKKVPQQPQYWDRRKETIDYEFTSHVFIKRDAKDNGHSAVSGRLLYVEYQIHPRHLGYDIIEESVADPKLSFWAKTIETTERHIAWASSLESAEKIAEEKIHRVLDIVKRHCKSIEVEKRQMYTI